MGCGCSDKKIVDVPSAPVASEALTVPCEGCHVTRILPNGLQFGDVFTLVPCPRCATPLKGRFMGTKVEVL